MFTEYEKFNAALMALWPHGDSKVPGLRAGIIKWAPTFFPKYGFDSSLVVAHAMAQFTHECGAGTDVVENLNYRAAALHAQWPTHFTMAQALQMQHQPELIANQAYNGRMGNRPGTTDGWDYRGRGPSQVTGRDEYAALAEETGLPLVDKPDLVNDPANFLLCGVADFVACKCLPYARQDNLVAVSGLLNVGHIVRASEIIGFAERASNLKLWKHALGVA